jgi:hypothetical protein
MDFARPDCHANQPSSCTEADWVQCVECARLICPVHEEVARVLHAGKYAASVDGICAHCVQTLFERGEVATIRNGYQYINRR